jgi:hypothetical protein
MLMSAQKAKPANAPKNEKAAKLSKAIEQVFQGHKAKVGSKTLLSIAWCFATVER